MTSIGFVYFYDNQSHRLNSVQRIGTHKLEVVISNSNSSLIAVETVVSNTKNPVKNIYYIKVHKTGSTTMQNILLRFGFDNELVFASFNCLHGMAFPNTAEAKYLIPAPQHKKFNIQAEHARFDPKAFTSYMDPKTQIIGQIRHPLKYLSSVFGFESLHSKFHMASDPHTLYKFLENPDQYDRRGIWSSGSNQCLPKVTPSYTKNSMAFHFGYSNQRNQSEASIKKFLDMLDKNVHLVLVLEKFDESLLVLKRKFDWNISNILYLPIGSLKFHRKHEYKTDINNNYLIDLHKKWAAVDYALYEHFDNKLTNILKEQNSDFAEELEYFKTLIRKVKTFCMSMCSERKYFHGQNNVQAAKDELSATRLLVKKSNWNEEFAVTHLDCVKMVLGTVEYQQAIIAYQYPSVCQKTQTLRSMKFNRNYCIKDQYICYTFPWSMVKMKLFVSRSNCEKFVKG